MSLILAAYLLGYDGSDYFDVKKELVGLSDKSFLRCGLVAKKQDEPLDLVSIISISLCNNPKTKESWAGANIQAEQLGVAKSAQMPTLVATGQLTENRNEQTGKNGDERFSQNSSSTFNQKGVGIQASYLLYDFGATTASIGSAKNLLNAAILSHNETVQTVFLQAVQAYYNLYASIASEQAFKEAEKFANESLAAAESRYSVGAATPADKLQAKTAYSQAVLNRVKAEGQTKIARGVLANTMGSEPNLKLNIVPPNEQTPSDEAMQEIKKLILTAKSERPDVLSAKAQVEAAKQSAKQAEALGLPTLSLNSSYNYTDSSQSTTKNGLIGVYLNIPIFTGFNRSYQIRAAKEQIKLKEAQLEATAQQASLDVWQAYQNVITDKEALTSSEDLLTSAAQSREVVFGRYKAGVGSILDLLNAESALASAKQQKISSYYSYRISKAALAQAIGKLDFDTIK